MFCSFPSHPSSTPEALKKTYTPTPEIRTLNLQRATINLQFCPGGRVKITLLLKPERWSCHPETEAVKNNNGATRGILSFTLPLGKRSRACHTTTDDSSLFVTAVFIHLASRMILGSFTSMLPQEIASSRSDFSSRHAETALEMTFAAFLLQESSVTWR